MTIPNTREKLIELLYEAHNKITDECCMGGKDMSYAEEIGMEADHLIANGVTVQEWISVKDRLPEKSGRYLVVAYNGFIENLHYSSKHKAFNAYDDFVDADKSICCTHWMHLPEPPKGE